MQDIKIEKISITLKEFLTACSFVFVFGIGYYKIISKIDNLGVKTIALDKKVNYKADRRELEDLKKYVDKSINMTNEIMGVKLDSISSKMDYMLLGNVNKTK